MMNIHNLYSKRAVTVLIISSIILFLSPARVFADSYDVTAVVPFDPPTIAAAVNAPADNTTVNTNNVDISGTCQVLNPAAIISVWNGATQLGSTACQVGGNYSINIALYEGVNVLTVRSSNINLLYGPDSSPFTITYAPDTPPAPAPSPDPATGEVPAPPGPSGPAQDPAASRELLITSTAPFGIMDENNFVSITLQVSGGKYPYILNINWGDGTTMTQKLEKEGDFTFTHVYENAGTYNVLALLTDVLGFSRTYNWVVTVSTQSLNQDNTVIVASANETNFRPFIYILILLGILLFAFTTFLYGRYYQSREQNKNIVVLPKKKARKK